MKDLNSILEIDKILLILKKYLKTPEAFNFIDNLKPYNDIEICNDELKLVEEALSLYNLYNDIPIFHHSSIRLISYDISKGNILTCDDLIHIKDFLSTINDLKSYYNKIILSDLKICNYFKDLNPYQFIIDKIDSIIDNNGEIKDNASYNLAKIRNKLRQIDNQNHDLINKLIILYKDKLNLDNYSIKNEVFVLPVNSSYKNTINGIVHDISQSGQTTFIEPIEILQLNNKKRILEIEEKEEITLILKEVSKIIENNIESLIKNEEYVTKLDILFSKVKFLNQIKGNIIYLNKNKKLDLINAKHPLLNQNEVVGNNFKLNEDKRILFISGPNAGGKTIALKTISILSYMAKLALPLSCDIDSNIPYFNNIFIDIGDNQSIENNLSTFSAHISNLSVILKSSTSKDLVILDELASGTDPNEGESLSISIINYLLNKGLLAIISSHYPKLKQICLLNKNISSASFLFDEDKLIPTFKMIYNIYGKSFAFIIAKEYGIPDEIIENAKNFYNNEYSNEFDNKLEYIQNKEKELYDKEHMLDDKIILLSKKEKSINEKEDKLQSDINNLKNKKIDELDKIIEEKIQNIEEIYNKTKISNKKELNDAINKIEKNTLKIEEEYNFNIGDAVKIKTLNLDGIIYNIKKNLYYIKTNDGLTFKTEKNKLMPINKKALTKQKNLNNLDRKILNNNKINYSLNIIGKRAIEAENEVILFLSNSNAIGLKEVKIIHGFGAGILRKLTHKILKQTPYVSQYKLGNDENGNGGVTIVNFK
ncbi:MAG: endonuclease MutS2 [Bacillales bacterium]